MYSACMMTMDESRVLNIIVYLFGIDIYIYVIIYCNGQLMSWQLLCMPNHGTPAPFGWRFLAAG